MLILRSITYFFVFLRLTISLLPSLIPRVLGSSLYPHSRESKEKRNIQGLTHDFCYRCTFTVTRVWILHTSFWIDSWSFCLLKICYWRHDVGLWSLFLFWNRDRISGVVVLGIFLFHYLTLSIFKIVYTRHFLPILLLFRPEYDPLI